MSSRKKYEAIDREELIAALHIKDKSLADLEAEVMRVGQTCTSYSDKLHYYRIGAEQMERRIKELEAAALD